MWVWVGEVGLLEVILVEWVVVVLCFWVVVEEVVECGVIFVLEFYGGMFVDIVLSMLCLLIEVGSLFLLMYW